MCRFARLGVLALLAGFLSGSATDGIAQEKTIKVKRRHDLSEEELQKQLRNPELIPEVGFDQTGSDQRGMHKPGVNLVYGNLELANKKKIDPSPEIGLFWYRKWAISINEKEKWTALPWRPLQDAQLGHESAKRLGVLSVNLRKYMRESASKEDPRPNPDQLRAALIGLSALEWDRPEAVPTLMQMLQTEDSPIRALLVELLAKINGREASVALAQRAVFDLNSKIREEAVRALAARPRKEFQKVLLDTLRSPWAPAADHGAEAIAALQIKELQSELVQLLKEPDPVLPFEGEVSGFKSPVVREMVRLNHLSNCCLCHAPSTSTGDLVRGRVPTPGQEMREPYYAETTGTFIRADITFLRQDFSLVQPVSEPKKWGGQQRFDYMLRTRKATPMEVGLLQKLQRGKKLGDPYPQREAIMFALRELHGRDLGDRPENWLPLLNPIRGRPEPKESK